MKKLLFILFFGLFAIPIKPIITGAETYVDKDKKRYVTFVHTLHMDYADKNITQREQASLISHARALDAGIAVEDSLGYEGTDAEVKRCIDERTCGKMGSAHHSKINIKNSQCGWQRATIADPAMKFMDLSKKHTVPCYNIDAGRVVQMAAVWSDAAGKSFAIDGQKVWDSIKEEINILLSCDSDGAFFLYPLVINRFLNENENYLSIMRTQKDLRALYLKDANKWNFLCFELVNLRILHALSLFDGKKHIFVITGGLHSEKLVPVLKKELGYTQVHSQLNAVRSPNGADIETECLDLESYFKTLDQVLQKESRSKQ